MIVNCYSEVDINLDDDEKEAIVKAYEILKGKIGFAGIADRQF